MITKKLWENKIGHSNFLKVTKHSTVPLIPALSPRQRGPLHCGGRESIETRWGGGANPEAPVQIFNRVYRFKRVYHNNGMFYRPWERLQKLCSHFFFTFIHHIFLESVINFETEILWRGVIWIMYHDMSIVVLFFVFHRGWRPDLNEWKLMVWEVPCLHDGFYKCFTSILVWLFFEIKILSKR